MADRERSYAASLTIGGSEIPVSVRYASRYSLWVHPEGSGISLPTGTESRLRMEIDDRLIAIDPCRIVSDGTADDKAWRLVPLGTIYDFEALFFSIRLKTLESSTLNLPLILSYKRSVEPEFSRYVSELTYDLSAYKAVFDQIDQEISPEPANVREYLQKQILASVGNELLAYLDSQYNRLVTLTKTFSDNQHEHHGFYFRRQLWTTILGAPIMARTNLKPRGYIGDSEMMRMLYDNDYQGDTTFGKLLHRHAVRQPAAQAVRNRRGDLARILRDFVARRTAATVGDHLSPAKVLSVACGPAMELLEIFEIAKDCESITYSLLDQDNHALLEAGKVIESIEQKLHTRISADFIKESVRTMLVTRELRNRWGSFDFIYSMGLFDYLTKPVATAVLKKLFALLQPGGEMIIGNFALNNPSFAYMAYWMDWSIIYRTDDDMLALASEVNPAESRVYRDDTGIQIFLHLRKQGIDE